MLLRQICTDCVFGRESALPPLFFLLLSVCGSFFRSFVSVFVSHSCERTDRTSSPRQSRRRVGVESVSTEATSPSDEFSNVASPRSMAVQYAYSEGFARDPHQSTPLNTRKGGGGQRTHVVESLYDTTPGCYQRLDAIREDCHHPHVLLLSLCCASFVSASGTQSGTSWRERQNTNNCLFPPWAKTT